MTSTCATACRTPRLASSPSTGTPPTPTTWSSATTTPSPLRWNSVRVGAATSACAPPSTWIGSTATSASAGPRATTPA
ncbi:hypothetical protein G6F59_016717 [Rhizopus arrhizus]|nr:hypothetical protein G6F24_016494 [Rhizopus arrhizus]KAG1386740.1 hypothetical protein G6F59_016717 [Rhizopus arrhizus]